MKKITLLVFSVFFLCFSCKKNKSILCAIYYEEGKYKEAFECLKPLAEQGNAEAQYNIGVMYEKGQGIPEDDTKAIEWYTKAAKQGFVDAQFNLGSMYYEGIGVPKDYIKAKEWFEKAAKQEFADAQFNLGLLYYFGEGVQKDDTIAEKWFNIACDNGYQAACNAYKELNEINIK